MHILVLPSWYPVRNDSSGIFIKEQALALASYSNNHISIIDWGPNDYVIKLRSPKETIRNMVAYMKALPEKNKLRANLIEYHIPHITWTSHILNGNHDALIPIISSKINQIEKENGAIDIIHAHVTFPAGYIAKYLYDQLSIPYVITEHSGPFPFREFYQGNSLKDIVRIPLCRASNVIAVSRWLAYSIRTFVEREITVIPNSVNTLFFKPANNIINHQRPQLFTLSNLDYQKGLTDLLYAIKLIKNKKYSLELRVGGEGKHGNKLKKLANKFGLDTCITWLGKLTREEALSEYQDCDFYVMPSRLESLSMVILEALACGKPVVATDCGGPSETINSDNGLLVQSNNPQSIADGLEQMLNKYSDYNSSLIREKCIVRYSDEVIVRKLIEVYSNVLRKN